jgi:hypothetical protein
MGLKLGITKPEELSLRGSAAAQYKQVSRVGGFARKHSSQRTIWSGANPEGSDGFSGSSLRNRMFSLSFGKHSSNCLDYTFAGRLEFRLQAAASLASS